MPLDWRGLVDGMSEVMKLVHLASRMDSIDQDEWRTTFLRQRRAAYEDELNIQAQRVGCNRRARLSNGPILSALNADCETDAESVVNTFNYYLAAAIIRIHDEVPTANRNVYAARLAAWTPQYWGWKQPQIDQMTDGTARAKAQQDFYQYNGSGFGTARLLPTTAVCPVCQGWIARGVVPLRVAQSNPPPYHPGCPHYWSTRPDKVAREDCPNLWMGE